MNRTVLAACILALAAAPLPPAAALEPGTPSDGLAKIRADAVALTPLVKTPLGLRFIGAAPSLPEPEPRTLYINPSTRAWYTAAAAAELPEETRAQLNERAADSTLYYHTRYGSPLAYVRAVEAAASADADPPFRTLEGKRVLDYGYGTVGHLRLMASLGADVVGVDVDPFLTTLYSLPSDQGSVAAAPGASRGGSVTLLSGKFPADQAIAAALGEKGFDLFLSKNTLKNGYIHPARPVDKRMLVDLGVSDEQFVAALFERLNPGGLVLIYNISPAPSKDDEPYRPWSDGRCPFPLEMLEKAGFIVLAFDENDDPAVRDMARALGWDASGMDVEGDLFALFTIAQKPPVAPPQPPPGSTVSP